MQEDDRCSWSFVDWKPRVDNNPLDDGHTVMNYSSVNWTTFDLDNPWEGSAVRRQELVMIVILM